MKEYYNKNNGEYGFNDWNHKESLTHIYHSVPQEIKDDFYTNNFDGDVSEFYLKDKDIICGVLGKIIERVKPSGKVVKGVQIYGIYCNKGKEEDVKLLLDRYTSLSLMFKITRGKPYKQKYFFAEAMAENDEQIAMLKSLGFHKDQNLKDTYYKKV